MRRDLHFAEMINKMSGGKLQITVHPAGELMPAFEVFDGVRKGVVEDGRRLVHVLDRKRHRF